MTGYKHTAPLALSNNSLTKSSQVKF